MVVVRLHLFLLKILREGFFHIVHNKEQILRLKAEKILSSHAIDISFFKGNRNRVHFL